MNEVRRFQLKSLLTAAVVAIIAASTVIWANDRPDNPYPREARISSNTRCGPISRSEGDPIYAIYGELARYVDAGATVIGHSDNEQSGGETFVLCGPLHGQPTN
jgi:hypothetical protein